MLCGKRRGPVARKKDDENHCDENGIPKPEAALDPKREDSAGGGNQQLGSVCLRRMSTEESGLHSSAEQTNRAGGERFLHSMAKETRLRSGGLGTRVTSRR